MKRPKKKWADPLNETADSALGQAPDAADLSLPPAADPITAEPDRPRTESFIDHLLAMPDVGDDADFALPRSGPRFVEL